jgi:SpoVK/Ycf46/Vps4 family AAA+-type ATPase
MTPAGARSELHDKGRTNMASSGKKKTTMAKLTRESKLRERRMDKQARKDARRQLIAQGIDPYAPPLGDQEGDDPDAPDATEPSLQAVGQAGAEA